MTKTHGLLLILVLFFNSLLFSQDANPYWNQWRGASKQGVSVVDAPIYWSDSVNVVWKTEIQGVGHSSPVAENGNIVLTTAYYTLKHNVILKLVRYLLLFLGLLTLIVCLYSVIVFFRQVNVISLSQVLTWISFSFLLGLLFYFVFLGHLFVTPEKADHITTSIKWFQSIMVVAFSFLLIVYFSFTKRIAQILLVILAITTALGVFFRPHAEYYLLLETSFMTPIIYKTIVFSILVIVLYGFNILIDKYNWFANSFMSKPVFNSKFVGLIVFVCLLVFVAGLFGIQLYRWLIYQLPSGSFAVPTANLYYRDGYIYYRLLLLAFVFSFIVLVLRKNIQFWPSQKWFVGLLLAIVILMFIEKNYLSISREYCRAVICIDKNNGEQKWVKELFVGDEMSMHLDNSAASPTPLIINDTIVAYFGSPGLACLNNKGQVIWENTDLPFDGIHGIGTSPVYRDGYIIILNDTPKAPYIVKLKLSDGSVVWKKDREPWEGIHGEHRTPTLVDFHDSTLIVTWGNYKLNVYNFTDGTMLAELPLDHYGHGVAATILLQGDTLFAAEPKSVRAISISQLLTKSENAILWAADMQNRGSGTASPVLYKGVLFTISDNGMLKALDIETGELLAQKKLKGQFLSSAVVFGSSLYVSDLNGITTVVSSNRDLELRSVNQLSEPIYATIVPLEGNLLIRTKKYLYCIGSYN